MEILLVIYFDKYTLLILTNIAVLNIINYVDNQQKSLFRINESLLLKHKTLSLMKIMNSSQIKHISITFYNIQKVLENS